jgi:hypothetical protein
VELPVPLGPRIGVSHIVWHGSELGEEMGRSLLHKGLTADSHVEAEDLSFAIVSLVKIGRRVV